MYFNLFLFSNGSHSGWWDPPGGSVSVCYVPSLTFRHHRALGLFLGLPSLALESAVSAGAPLPVTRVGHKIHDLGVKCAFAPGASPRLSLSWVRAGEYVRAPR